MEKLLNEMIIEAAIVGDIIYTNKGDHDTIDILTKQCKPTKKYSKLSIQIFNDLNQLSGVVEKRNGKSKLICNSIILNEQDRHKRINSVRGSIIAGNDNKKMNDELKDLTNQEDVIQNQ